MSNDEYVPSLETLLEHYEELSLTVSRDPEIAKDNRRIAEKAIDRALRDAAREALDGVVDDVRADWHRSHHWVTQPIEEYRDTYYPEETP